MKLWDLVNELKSDRYEWVELSHPVSPETPHWIGFDPFQNLGLALDYHEEGYDVISYYYKIVTQYGTHVDAPCHFIPGAASLDQIPTKSTMFPLCVINAADKVKANNDYALTIDDVLEYESRYGTIPEGAFVAMRSDWSKRSDFENNDADGNPHYPGWKLETLKFLVEERNVGAIGHEPTDTDAPAAGLGWIGERYILSTGRFQVEVMKNLDLVPESGAMIMVTTPRVVGATGFTARCIAIYEK